jgi:Ni/Co efflux regulator RcnB
MRKTILTILGSALLAASVAQAANAAGHRTHKADRAPATVSETVRDSNAYWSAPSGQSDWSRYQSGGLSAPAGH